MTQSNSIIFNSNDNKTCSYNRGNNQNDLKILHPAVCLQWL